MRYGTAIWSGVLGALVMSIVMSLTRAAGVPVDLELVLGSIFTGAVHGGAFGLGLVIHLALGAIFGVIYGAIFESWREANAARGVSLGFVHAVITGFLLMFIPPMHPVVPEVLPAPGPYMAGVGLLGVAAYFAIHLIYGAIVGATYGRVQRIAAASHPRALEPRAARAASPPPPP